MPQYLPPQNNTAVPPGSQSLPQRHQVQQVAALQFWSSPGLKDLLGRDSWMQTTKWMLVTQGIKRFMEGHGLPQETGGKAQEASSKLSRNSQERVGVSHSPAIGTVWMGGLG